MLFTWDVGLFEPEMIGFEMCTNYDASSGSGLELCLGKERLENIYKIRIASAKF